MGSRPFAISLIFGATTVLAGLMTDADAFSRFRTACPMRIEIFPEQTRFSDPHDFRASATLFLSAVPPEETDALLSGVAPGGARDVSARFIGDDARWRLLRPLPIVDDPDALIEIPAQIQYLLRPDPQAVYTQLILVGLPAERGQVDWPAMAGRLGAGAGPRAGQLFTLEPETPDTCKLDPGQAASQAQALLGAYLEIDT